MRHLAALLSLALLAAACGGDESDRQISARNLSTGEVKTFSSAAAVPDGWAPCDDPTCSIPPTVPCHKLGTDVCTLSPECRLKELWCQGVACACAACMPGASCPPCDCPPPPPPVCEYTCIPKLPLLCEELKAEKECSARSDCSWGQFMCPAMACMQGQPCPPCPSSCIAKAPPLCQNLDQKACAARSDCQWQQADCAAVCIDDGKGGCLPCPSTGACAPAAPLPPGTCGPGDCPAMIPEIAFLCPDGTYVPRFDCVLQSNNTCGWAPDCSKSAPGADCDASYCGPAPLMPNYLCPDGKTTAGPTGKCLLQSSGKCGWEVITCPTK